MDIAYITRGPGQKGNFVDWSIKRDAVRVLINVMGQRGAVFRKTAHEQRGKDVQIVRPAIMKNIPDHLHTLLIGGFQHGCQGGKIKLSSSFNERPAGSVADGANIKASQQLVITGHL